MFSLLAKAELCLVRFSRLYLCSIIVCQIVPVFDVAVFVIALVLNVLVFNIAITDVCIVVLIRYLRKVRVRVNVGHYVDVLCIS